MDNYWLLPAAIRAVFEAAYANWGEYAQQQLEYEARYAAAGSDGSTTRILTVAGDVAQINITGVMTAAPNIIAMLFGGGNVTYGEIIKSLAIAKSDPSIKRAVLMMDSNGGTIDGLFEALAAIEDFDKPIEAVVRNKAASAGYAMAAATGKITAVDQAVRFGSVGVVIEGYVDPNRVSITSTKAPNKRPDVTTPEGKAVIREELDALHDLFVEAIAAGRGTTVDKVNADFGQGATLVAREALKRGMIDAIAGVTPGVAKSSNTTLSASSGGDIPEANMDLNKLKADHPNVYAQAVSEGVTQGVAKERDRVSAHLTMGQMSGDIDTAVKAAIDGTEMTQALQAKYIMTAANKRDTQNRQDDDEQAGGAAKAKGGKDAAETEAEAVLAVVQAHYGIPSNAGGAQ